MLSLKSMLLLHYPAMVFIIVLSIMMLINAAHSSLISEEVWVIFTATRNNVYDMIFGSNFHPRITPVGHLFVVRMLHALFGDNDYMYRLPVLLFHLASYGIGYIFTLRFTKSRSAAIFFLLLWALNFTTIGYGYELKQYTADSFFSLLILMAYFELSQRNLLTSYRYIFLLIAISLCGIIFSHTAIFSIATVSLLWMLRSIKRKNFIHVSIYSIVTICCFLPLYFFIIREPALIFSRMADGHYSHYYIEASGFFGIATTIFQRLIGFMSYFSTQNFIGAIFGIGPMPYLVIWMASLLLLLSEKKYHSFLLLTIPFIIAFLLALLELYPFGGHRTSRYLSPLVSITIAYGLSFLIKKIVSYRYESIMTNALVLYGTILSFWAYNSIAQAQFAHNYMSIYLQNVAEERQVSDAVVYCPNAKLQVEYYQPTLLDKPSIGITSYSNADGIMNDILMHGQHSRYWFICTRSEQLEQLSNPLCSIEKIYRNKDDKIAFVQLIDCKNSVVKK